MKLLNSSFASGAGGKGRGGGGVKLEEVFIFLDPSCAASEHVWFGQPEPKCDSEASSSHSTPHPGCSTWPDPGHKSGAAGCPCRIRPAGRDTSSSAHVALACHTWATTMTHGTSLGVGAGVQIQSKKCNRGRGAGSTKCQTPPAPQCFLVTPRLNLPEPSSTSKPRSFPWALMNMTLVLVSQITPTAPVL